MPCYDERSSPSYVREDTLREARETFRHNSDVAELLCSLMKVLSSNPGVRVVDLPVPTKVQQWWKEHKARDALKAKQEKENARRKVEKAERELRAAQEALKKIK